MATPVGYGRVQYGYISNIVSAEQGVGTAECPWYIQVRRGQRINFTILNFLGQSVSKHVNQLVRIRKFFSATNYAIQSVLQSTGRLKTVTRRHS